MAALWNQAAGWIVLLGFSVQMRAQPHGTFKLLFNPLLAAGAGEASAAGGVRRTE